MKDRFLQALAQKPFVFNMCIMCGHMRAYRVVGGILGYDGGCSCGSNRRDPNWQPRSTDELDQYLDPKTTWPAIIKKFIEDVEKSKKTAQEKFWAGQDMSRDELVQLKFIDRIRWTVSTHFQKGFNAGEVYSKMFELGIDGGMGISEIHQLLIEFYGPPDSKNL